MEQVYLAPCTEYQYEPLKQAVDDTVSYTHLDVYKRQGVYCLSCYVEL